MLARGTATKAMLACGKERILGFNKVYLMLTLSMSWHMVMHVHSCHTQAGGAKGVRHCADECIGVVNSDVRGSGGSAQKLSRHVASRLPEGICS